MIWRQAGPISSDRGGMVAERTIAQASPPNVRFDFQSLEERRFLSAGASLVPPGASIAIVGGGPAPVAIAVNSGAPSTFRPNTHLAHKSNHEDDDADDIDNDDPVTLASQSSFPTPVSLTAPTASSANWIASEASETLLFHSSQGDAALLRDTADAQGISGEDGPTSGRGTMADILPARPVSARIADVGAGLIAAPDKTDVDGPVGSTTMGEHLLVTAAKIEAAPIAALEADAPAVINSILNSEATFDDAITHFVNQCAGLFEAATPWRAMTNSHRRAWMVTYATVLVDLCVAAWLVRRAPRRRRARQQLHRTHAPNYPAPRQAGPPSPFSVVPTIKRDRYASLNR